MKAKRILALLLALCLIVTAFAACGNSEDGSSATSGGGTSETTSGGDDAEPTDVSTGPDDTSELYEFTVYYNYTGWSKVWGEDATSQYISDKFNIDIDWTAPDSDPMAKLNLMVSSNDLPEVIVMDRGPDLNKIAAGGYLVDLEPLMYEGCSFAEDIPRRPASC